MLNQVSHIVLSCVLLLLSVSCKNRQDLEKTLSGFVQSEVIVPDDLDGVYGRRVSSIVLDSLKSYKFIVYYDSLDCMSCRMAYLGELEPLFDLAKENGEFSPVVIFSPRMEEVEELKAKLVASNLAFPVYIDTWGSFAACNYCIPSDELFHGFLIDGSGTPVFVGLPYKSDSLRRLFDHIFINN